MAVQDNETIGARYATELLYSPGQIFMNVLVAVILTQFTRAATEEARKDRCGAGGGKAGRGKGGAGGGRASERGDGPSSVDFPNH